jgi:hypothetical protein
MQTDRRMDGAGGRTTINTQRSLSEDMCIALIRALRHFGPGVSDTIITCWFQPTYSFILKQRIAPMVVEQPHAVLSTQRQMLRRLDRG